MNKKNRLTIAVCSALSFSVYAEEAVPLSVGFGIDQGFSALIQLDSNKNLAVGNEGIAFDYIFNKGAFDNADFPFTWYVGAGGWIGWDNKSDQFGARLPLGLDWDFAENWDAYAQIHPELNYDNRANDLKLEVGAGVGIRYTF